MKLKLEEQAFIKIFCTRDFVHAKPLGERVHVLERFVHVHERGKSCTLLIIT